MAPQILKCPVKSKNFEAFFVRLFENRVKRFESIVQLLKGRSEINVIVPRFGLTLPLSDLKEIFLNLQMKYCGRFLIRVYYFFMIDASWTGLKLGEV